MTTNPATLPVSRRSRNPWPIVIIGYFVVFGSLIVAFTVFALRQKNDLVAANYYDDEIRYQKQVDRLSRTAPLRDQIAIAYQADAQAIQVTLPPAHQGASGTIRLYRPSDAAADVQLKLATDPHGAQLIPTNTLRAGRWKVRLVWQLAGEEYFFEDTVIIDGQPRPVATGAP